MATQANHSRPVQNGILISSTSSSGSPSVPPSNPQNLPPPLSASRPPSSDSQPAAPPATERRGIQNPGPNTAQTQSPLFALPGHHVSPPMQQRPSIHHSAPPNARPYSQSFHPPQMQQRFHPQNITNPAQPPPPHMHQHYHRHPPSAPGPSTQHHPPLAKGDSPPPNRCLPSPNSTISFQDSAPYQDLMKMVSSMDAGVVRQVIRDHWETTILGSEYHVGFLLNATMHQASNENLCRAVQDFGGRMIRVSKEHVVRHLKAEDIDEVADLLLSEASSSFLDKALARHLETIPARQLVNALARAERLGYDAHDVVNEDQDGREHVIPFLHSLPLPPQIISASTAPSSSLAPSASQMSASPSAQTDLQAEIKTPTKNAPIPSQQGIKAIYCQCGWPCSSERALAYHKKKRSCLRVCPSDRVGKELCAHCGCRFTSGGGLQYHGKVRVCGTYTQEQTQYISSLVHEFRKNKAVGTRAASTPSKELVLPPSHDSSSDQGATQLGEVYADLTPNQKQELKLEMKNSEDYYGGLMREAMKLPEPERSKQLAALKNRYNTKQSITRKKYGIRLRERRTKAEINAERMRLFGTLDGPSLSGNGTASSAYKRARISEDGGESMITKRPDESQVDTPHKRVSIAEMGGLIGSQATAEMEDPTALPRPVQPWHVLQGQAKPTLIRQTGTKDDPMAINDDSTTESDDEDTLTSVRDRT